MTAINSNHQYSREEAVKRLKARKWFEATDADIKDKILNLPEDYNGFINDLCDREEASNELQLIKMTALNLAETSVIPVFLVKSQVSGKTYERTFITYRDGSRHALRGLILIENNGVLSHFLVRKCNRFEVNRVVYESLGSINPPKTERHDPQFLGAYVEDQLARILNLPRLEIKRFIDLGEVNPDGSVANLVAGLFTAVINVDDTKAFEKAVCGKEYDKGYVYSFEMMPIAEFFNFLGKTDDGYLLSIFGRLQALNVIKL